MGPSYPIMKWEGCGGVGREEGGVEVRGTTVCWQDEEPTTT